MSAAAENVLAGLRFGGGKRLPVILQTEAAECGLACLAMVASYYGYEIDLPGMRRRASMSLKGATLRRVMDIAGQLALDTRALRLEIEDLAALKAPVPSTCSGCSIRSSPARITSCSPCSGLAF